MKLVENWTSSYKWLSMHFTAIGMAGAATYAALPDKLQDAIPHNLVPWLAMGIFVLIFAGRITNQGGKYADSVKTPLA